MISANTPIYRNDKDLGEHYVIFKPDTIERIRKKFMLEGRNHAVNKMHDMERITNGAIMVDSYIIGGEKNPSAPEAIFANEFTGRNVDRFLLYQGRHVMERG